MAYNYGRKPKAKKRGTAIPGQKRRLGKPSPFDIRRKAEAAFPERPKPPKLKKERPPRKKRPPRKRKVVIGPRF